MNTQLREEIQGVVDSVRTELFNKILQVDAGLKSHDKTIHDSAELRPVLNSLKKDVGAVRINVNRAPEGIDIAVDKNEDRFVRVSKRLQRLEALVQYVGQETILPRQYPLGT